MYPPPPNLPINELSISSFHLVEKFIFQDSIQNISLYLYNLENSVFGQLLGRIDKDMQTGGREIRAVGWGCHGGCLAMALYTNELMLKLGHL